MDMNSIRDLVSGCIGLGLYEDKVDAIRLRGFEADCQEAWRVQKGRRGKHCIDDRRSFVLLYLPSTDTLRVLFAQCTLHAHSGFSAKA